MPLAGNELKKPPEPTEAEISIFGPGYGECIVAHLGYGDWIVVDSCLSSFVREPKVLEYFDEIGVDPAVAIKRVIATHWHDDHIGGLAAVFEAAEEAEFWCSMALKSTEWVHLIELHRFSSSPCSSGLREIQRIMDEIKRRTAKNGVASPKFAIEGLPLFARSSERLHASVVAYSPSHGAIHCMQAEIVNLLNGAKRGRQAVPALGSNDASVVIAVRVGDASVLLGADLEEHGKIGLGWTAVLACADPNLRFQGFKVPHHGSQTGHHKDVWPRMMRNSAWAAITPWSRGRGLPTEDDAKRICAESNDNAYLTAPPHASKYKHPDPAVLRTFNEMGVRPQKDIGKQGHIRLRCKATEPHSWKIELFGAASKLGSPA